jgi:hypothetical protein
VVCKLYLNKNVKTNIHTVKIMVERQEHPLDLRIRLKFKSWLYVHCLYDPKFLLNLRLPIKSGYNSNPYICKIVGRLGETHEST